MIAFQEISEKQKSFESFSLKLENYFFPNNKH